MPNRFTKVGAQQVALLGGNAKMASDPKRNQTVLHLSTLGAIRGEQNNTFVDDSPNRFSITRTGNVAPSTFSPYGDSWSNYFDGSGDYLSVAGNAAFDVVASDFTIEAWIYRTTNNVEQYILSQRSDSPISGWEFRINATNLLSFFYNGGSVIISSSSVPTNRWTHIAATRTGTTVRLFIDGSQVGSSTFANGVSAAGTALFVGYGTTGGGYLTGNISNLRIVKGTALYTANFTPSKTPLTAVSGTSLLTCASNRFQDKSSNNFSITPAGNVAVKTASPFPQTREFKKPQRGWCVPFNGSTQRLETPAASVANGLQLGTSDFTIECWVKAKPQGAYNRIVDGGAYLGANNSFNLVTDGVAGGAGVHFGMFKGDGSQDYIGLDLPNVLTNTWRHIAIVKTNGRVYGYVDGALIMSAPIIANTNNLNFVTPITIGVYKNPTNSTYSNYFSGKISNVMIVKKALYSGNFVPMQSPRTADQNGTLPVLLTCQGSSIYDYSYSSQTLTSAGSLVVDSDGPFDQDDELSYYFDGNGDYLSVADNAALELGSGDFTIEAWVNSAVAAKPENNSDATRHSVAITKGGSYALGILGNTTSRYGIFFSSYDGTSWVSTEGYDTILPNTWYHIAATRQSGTLRLFVNGVLKNTVTGYTRSFQNNANAMTLGANSGTDYALNGYISNARLVTGAALYTANFTPSRKPLGIASSGTTSLILCRGRGPANTGTANDGVTTGLTITPFGTAGTTANPVSNKSPFHDDERYGMSYYFDGSGDYLNVNHTGAVITPLQFGAGDFTIECWIYPLAIPTSTQVFLDFLGASNVSGTYPRLDITPGGVFAYRVSGAYRITGTTTLKINTWYHVAITKSSNVTRMFINGIQDGASYSDSVNYLVGSNRPMLGASGYNTAGNIYFSGYMSGVSIQKSVAKYTAAFTPPTSPQLTGDYSQSLMLNAYPAIYDTTRKNAIETVGSYNGANGGPPWSTRAERYSFYFNGTNDYINIPSSPDFDFGTGDFTIETWLYLAGNSLADAGGLRIAAIASCYNNAGQGWEIYISGNSTTTGLGLGIENWSSSTYTVIGRDFSISQLIWCHVAVTRKSGIVRIFLNGVQQGTDQAFTSNMSGGSANCWIGALNYTGYNRYLNGYIHDLRITKGVARYTSNFTLPKLPHPIK